MQAVVVVPTIHRLMTDATAILGSELNALLQRTRAGRDLTSEQSNKVSRYVHAITELAREERCQQAAANPWLAGLSDEDLVTEMLKSPEFAAKVRQAIVGGT